MGAPGTAGGWAGYRVTVVDLCPSKSLMVPERVLLMPRSFLVSVPFSLHLSGCKKVLLSLRAQLPERL